MNATGQYREEQRERAQEPDKPDSVEPELWEHLTDEQKRKTAEQGQLAVNERALRKHIESSDDGEAYSPHA